MCLGLFFIECVMLIVFHFVGTFALSIIVLSSNALQLEQLLCQQWHSLVLLVQTCWKILEFCWQDAKWILTTKFVIEPRITLIF